jgi:hypothetical protein
MRVGTAADEAVGLELADRLCHGLRAHALGHRKVADAARSLPVEPSEHAALRDGEAVLRAQAPDQLTQDDAQVTRQTGCVDRRHGRECRVATTDNLHRSPV